MFLNTAHKIKKMLFVNFLGFIIKKFNYKIDFDKKKEKNYVIMIKVVFYLFKLYKI